MAANPGISRACAWHAAAGLGVSPSVSARVFARRIACRDHRLPAGPERRTRDIHRESGRSIDKRIIGVVFHVRTHPRYRVESRWSPNRSASWRTAGSLLLVEKGKQPQTVACAQRAISFAGWDESGRYLAYVAEDDLPCKDRVLTRFCFCRMKNARTCVIVADGEGKDPGPKADVGIAGNLPALVSARSETHVVAHL